MKYFLAQNVPTSGTKLKLLPCYSGMLRLWNGSSVFLGVDLGRTGGGGGRVNGMIITSSRSAVKLLEMVRECLLRQLSVFP